MDWVKAQEYVGQGFGQHARKSTAADGRYYRDPQVYQDELAKVFGREWSYFCHQSQVPNTGDYLCGEVADEQVYVIRGRDDKIRAFFNVCVHRGHVLLEGQGNAKSVVVCPYHAWTYGLDGQLRGAPKMQEVEGFDRASVKLSEISTEVIGGFVFLNFDGQAPSLRDMAPEFERILHAMVPDVDQLQHVKQNTYDIKANWKVVVENFLEAYHVEFSGQAHRDLGDIIDIDTYKFDMQGRTIEYTALGGKPEALPYESNQSNAFANSKGFPFHQVFLYPHMTFSVFPGTNMLFVFNMRPVGAERTCEDIIYFTLDGSFSEPTSTAEAYVSDQLNPEDIALVEGVQKGLKSKGYKPGRLMVDVDEQAGWGEQFVHHFNMLNLDALTRQGKRS